MSNEIKTGKNYLTHLGINSEADARRVMNEKVVKANAAGQDLLVHIDLAPKTARVDFGRWMIDCECGSGVIVDSDWTAAYCLGCGAIIQNVVFPPDEQEIEMVLQERPFPKNQFWLPERGETLETLQVENAVNLRKN